MSIQNPKPRLGSHLAALTVTVLAGIGAVVLFMFGVLGGLSNVDTFLQWIHGDAPAQVLIKSLDPISLALVTAALCLVLGFAVGCLVMRLQYGPAINGDERRKLAEHAGSDSAGPELRLVWDPTDRRCFEGDGRSINIRVENVGVASAQGCGVVLESFLLNGQHQNFPLGRRFSVADVADREETFSVSGKSQEYVRLFYQKDHATHGAVTQIGLKGGLDVPPHPSMSLRLRLDGPRKATFYRMNLAPDPTRRGWMKVISFEVEPSPII